MALLRSISRVAGRTACRMPHTTTTPPRPLASLDKTYHIRLQSQGRVTRTFHSTATRSSASSSSSSLASCLFRGLRSVYSLDGGHVEKYTSYNRFKWHLKLTVRVIVIVGTALACITALVWVTTQMYVERLHPTPSVLSDRTRIGIRYVYLYGEVLDDKVLANENAKELPAMLEKEIQSRGGWEGAPENIKLATVAVLLKLADLKGQLGVDDQAIRIYEDLIKTDYLRGEQLASVMIKLGQSYSRRRRPEAAFDAYVKATQVAWESLFVYPLSSSVVVVQSSIPKLDYAKPVLPPPSKDIPPPTKELLDAATAVATEYCRSDPPQPAVAFPIFLSLLRAAEQQADRDACREAAIQAYLGEVMFSLGKTKDGYGWTTKALDNSEKGLIEGKGRTCRECAEYAVANAIVMRKSLGGSEEALENDVAAFRKRERILSRFL